MNTPAYFAPLPLTNEKSVITLISDEESPMLKQNGQTKELNLSGNC
jgi:hypothetical protein